MAHSAAFVSEMKEKLESEKARLEAELRRFAQPTGEGEFATRFEDFGDDEDENASEVEQYVDNRALEATLEGQLKEIVEALERVAQGTYGISVETGEPISEERLRAYPAARNAVV